jgi:glycosyltransferase involved in cell wall biosynthesis
MTMEQPLVTVVVPTLNRRALLADTVRSILTQTSLRVNLIVVDEGSSDGTLDDLAVLESAGVVVVRNKRPVGLPSARNLGLALVGTPWVAFCDDDDLWAPTKLSEQCAALMAEPKRRWSFTSSVMIDELRQIIGLQRYVDAAALSTEILTKNPIPGCASSVVVATEVARALGGFDPDMVACEDWDFCIRLSRQETPTIVDRPLVAIRKSRTSHSSSAVKMADGLDVIRRRYADERAQLHVDIDRAYNGRYLARLDLEAGDCWGAARRYGAVARSTRSPRAAGLALASLVAPAAVLSAGSHRMAKMVPAEWRRDTDQWLVGYRSSHSVVHQLGGHSRERMSSIA